MQARHLASLLVGVTLAFGAAADTFKNNSAAGDVSSASVTASGSTTARSLADRTADFVSLGVPATDSAPLGAEILSGSGWTSAGWTGSWATGWGHTIGNTSVLSYPTAAAVGTAYQIAYTITGRTAGTLTLALGGTSVSVSGTGAFGPKAISTDNLTATPTTDFDGTVVLSVKAITGSSAPTMTLRDSGSVVRMEGRTSSAASNLFLGLSAGGNNTTGVQNTASGAGALAFNTTGVQNTASGVNALQNNTTGNYNTASGVSALQNNTTGNYNTASGASALAFNTTGVQNTASGMSALQNNTTGNYNTASGVNALAFNTTGNYNTAVGVSTGQYLADGATANQTPSNSAYFGYGTRAQSASGTNETVIGYLAIGNGSNTVTLGNSSVTGVFTSGTFYSGGNPVGRKVAVPATATSAGSPGDFAADVSYAYFCVAANTWRRVGIGAW